MENLEQVTRHLVELNASLKKLMLFRMERNGEKIFLSEIEFSDVEETGIDEISRKLGENILLDSQVGRKLFGL